jgi:hypothetical protein
VSAARRLFGESGREEEAPLRHSTAACSPNGERACRRGARAAPPARSLRRRSGARSRRCGARERESGEEMRLGLRRSVTEPVLFDRKLRATVGSRWTAHRHRTEIQPRWGESFPSQAQVAAWSVGRAEHERAGGPFLGLGPFAGRERREVSREWAAGWFFGFGLFSRQTRTVFSARTGRGPNSISGRISTVNSRVS